MSTSWSKLVEAAVVLSKKVCFQVPFLCLRERRNNKSARLWLAK